MFASDASENTAITGLRCQWYYNSYCCLPLLFRIPQLPLASIADDVEFAISLRCRSRCNCHLSLLSFPSQMSLASTIIDVPDITWVLRHWLPFEFDVKNVQLSLTFWLSFAFITIKDAAAICLCSHFCYRCHMPLRSLILQLPFASNVEMLWQSCSEKKVDWAQNTK